MKLLRVLGEQTIQRVGSNQIIKVDVRVVAATNKNLEALVREGKFRDDLFYRLDVVPHPAAAAARPARGHSAADQRLSPRIRPAERARRSPALPPRRQEALQRYDWPGNVRELRAAIEHGVALCRGERIGLRDLPPRILGQRRAPACRPSAAPASLNLEAMEKHFIERALRQTDGNITDAAKLLGISRRTLHRKLKTYRLS